VRDGIVGLIERTNFSSPSLLYFYLGCARVIDICYAHPEHARAQTCCLSGDVCRRETLLHFDQK